MGTTKGKREEEGGVTMSKIEQSKAVAKFISMHPRCVDLITLHIVEREKNKEGLCMTTS